MTEPPDSAPAPDVEALARRAMEGDQVAFTRWVETTHGVVFRLARRQTRSDAEAEDVAQEAYIRAWQGMATLKDPAASVGWVCRIVRNLSTDKARWFARRPEVSYDAEADEALPLLERVASGEAGPEELVGREELKAFVHAAIDALAGKHRMVIVLKDVDGLSSEEVAEALDIPLGTVESRLHRARKKLAATLTRAAQRAQRAGARRTT